MTDNYKLAVKLVGPAMQLRENIVSTVEDASVLFFEDTDISLLELYELKESFSESARHNNNVLAYGVSVSESALLVDIVDEAGTAAARLSYNYAEFDNGDHIVFRMKDSRNQQQSTIEYLPGNRVHFDDGTPDGSLGWYGSWNGKCSFLTAGHVLGNFNGDRGTLVRSMHFGSDSVFDATKYTNSSYCIATYAGKNGDISSNGDYAILRCDTIEDTINPSAYVQLGYSTVGIVTWEDEISASLEKKTVAKGVGASGYRAGKIESSNCTMKVGANMTDNCISVMPITEATLNFFSKNGDSGCTVFYYDENAFASLLAIVIGGDYDEKNHTSGTFISYCTPIALINEETGFVPYVWGDLN